MINVKRVYEVPSAEDGDRILMDRLWLPGLMKEKAKVDLWMKEIAPSNELRKWYHNNLDKWSEFKKKYKKELGDNKAAFDELKKVIKQNKVVTFVYSSKEEKHNNAEALKEFLD
jgi:uncharacterized protein YeaO (DUF488 family)